MLALREWQNFYMLMGTAAATLIGLLFVAISIGSGVPALQARNYLRTFVNPVLLSYFQVLLISCLAIMPLQSPLILSAALAVLSAIDIILPLKIVWRIREVHRDDTIDLDHWLWHVLLPLLSGLIFVVVVVGLFSGRTLALLGLSVADMLCLTIGLRNSWVLMVWLTLHRAEQEERERQEALPASR